MTQPTSRDNPREPVLKLWGHIFGGERGLLQVWTGIRDEHGDIPRETSKAAFFNYPKGANAAAEWALEKSEEGREVYFCAHLLDKSRRIKENAAAVIPRPWSRHQGTTKLTGGLQTRYPRRPPSSSTKGWP